MEREGRIPLLSSACVQHESKNIETTYKQQLFVQTFKHVMTCFFCKYVLFNFRACYYNNINVSWDMMFYGYIQIECQKKKYPNRMQTLTKVLVTRIACCLSLGSVQIAYLSNYNMLIRVQPFVLKK